MNNVRLSNLSGLSSTSRHAGTSRRREAEAILNEEGMFKEASDTSKPEADCNSWSLDRHNQVQVKGMAFQS